MQTVPQGEASLALALECLDRSGHVRLRVTGASMLPSIRPGSYVRIRRAGVAEVSPGEVILARTGAGVRLHRLVEIRGSGWDALLITRGDNHEHCDPPLGAVQVLGVLTHVEAPERGNWFRRALRMA